MQYLERARVHYQHHQLQQGISRQPVSRGASELHLKRLWRGNPALLVMVFPESTIAVVWMLSISIHHTPTHPVPALTADHMPDRLLIDLTPAAQG